MMSNHRSLVDLDLYSNNVAEETAKIDLVDFDPAKLANACPNHPVVSDDIRCLSMFTIWPLAVNE